MTVYAVALSKGGSTKTTTAAELALHLTRQGRRVLAIDLDQQGDLTTRFGLTSEAEIDGDAADVMSGEMTAIEAACTVPSIEGLSVLVGTSKLSVVRDQPEAIVSLRDHLPEVQAHWDDVVIDTPPEMEVATIAALAAADSVIAAVTCAVEAYEKLDRMEEVLAVRVARRLRKGASVDWIVPTRFDKRRTLDNEVVALLKERFGSKVTAPIREAVVVKDSYTAGCPVGLYDESHPVSKDYTAALEQVTGLGSKGCA